MSAESQPNSEVALSDSGHRELESILPFPATFIAPGDMDPGIRCETWRTLPEGYFQLPPDTKNVETDLSALGGDAFFPLSSGFTIERGLSTIRGCGDIHFVRGLTTKDKDGHRFADGAPRVVLPLVVEPYDIEYKFPEGTKIGLHDSIYTFNVLGTEDLCEVKFVQVPNSSNPNGFPEDIKQIIADSGLVRAIPRPTMIRNHGRRNTAERRMDDEKRQIIARTEFYIADGSDEKKLREARQEWSDESIRRAVATNDIGKRRAYALAGNFLGFNFALPMLIVATADRWVLPGVQNYYLVQVNRALARTDHETKKGMPKTFNLVVIYKNGKHGVFPAREIVLSDSKNPLNLDIVVLCAKGANVTINLGEVENIGCLNQGGAEVFSKTAVADATLSR